MAIVGLSASASEAAAAKPVAGHIQSVVDI